MCYLTYQLCYITHLILNGRNVVSHDVSYNLLGVSYDTVALTVSVHPIANTLNSKAMQPW